MENFQKINLRAIVDVSLSKVFEIRLPEFRLSFLDFMICFLLQEF